MQEKYRESINNDFNNLSSIIVKLKEKKASLSKDEEIDKKIIMAAGSSIIKTKEMILNPKNILEISIAVRYLLEGLIYLKYIKEDEKFRYQLYYSIYISQLEKAKVALKRVDYEIEIMQKFADKEIRETDDVLYKQVIENTNDEDAVRLVDEMIELSDKVYEQYKKHITIFGDEIIDNGFSFHSYLINTKIKPEYEKRYEYMQKKVEEIGNQLLNNNRIRELFSEYITQKKRILETEITIEHIWWAMRDRTTMKDKAEKVKLLQEYEFMYRSTSDLIHFSSYSIFTKNAIDNKEYIMLLRMSHQYLQHFIGEIDF